MHATVAVWTTVNRAHRRSVAVLCMLYMIMCNPMHPLYGALPVSYVTVQITRGPVIDHRCTYAPPRGRTSQHRRTFISRQYLCGMILMSPYSMVWDWRVSRGGPMPFYWLSCSLPILLLLFSVSLLKFYVLVSWAGVFGLIGCWSLSHSFALPTFLNNYNNNQSSQEQLLVVSVSTHQLFTTWPIGKIKSITPLPISKASYSGWWALASPTKTMTALSSADRTLAISRRQSQSNPSCPGLCSRFSMSSQDRVIDPLPAKCWPAALCWPEALLLIVGAI